MIKKTTLWRFLVCPILLLSVSSLNLLSAQTGPNDDFDGDGVINSIDIDDDNDGVPDARESPSCFYSASEWNTGAKPTTNGVAITSALTTTLGNFGQLLDNVPGTTAVTFTAGQATLNTNVYLFTFAQPVRLDAIYLKFNITTQFASTTKIQGSNTNNGSDWVDLSAAISNTLGTNITANGLVEVTNSIKYPVTLNTSTAYKYIRITGAVASNIAAQNASEVYFDFNVANYVASYYPKATCTDANIDGDGILPHFDLDSDGDGCSDAYEAGATTSLATNYKFTGAVGVNGLDNTLETSDSGIVNYTSTYYVYAQNSAMQICKDTDGDGILDINDIDDDNDGVLDTSEQVLETCSGVFTTDSRVIWNPTFTNSNTTATGNATINGTPVSVTANTTKIFNALKDDHWHFGSGTYVGCPDVTTVISNSVINIFSNDYTVTYTFSRPVRNPSLSFSSFNGTAVLFPHPVYVSGLQGTVSGVSTGSYITTFPATENTVAVIYNGVFNSISFRVEGADAQGSVLLNIPYVLNAGSLTYTLTSGSPFGYLDIDTDGDGIVNRLDLDSDGDGCPDAREAGVSSNAGASASMSASGGSIYTGGIPSGTANAYVGNGTPSQYNANGFFNGIETAAESGVYNGTYMYSFATSAALNLCVDTDGDGVGDFIDIDDDNDGVVDAVESPACFYTANEWNTGAKPFYGVTISSGLTTTIGNFSQLIDGVSGTTAVAFSASPTQAIQNANVYLFNFAQPVKLDALYLQFNTLTQFGGTTKIQGSNTNNGSDWVDLSAAIGAGVATNVTANGAVSVTSSMKYSVTLNTATAYKYIRITGVAASNIVAANASEVYFDFNNASYIASSYPKAIICNNDPDNDTIPNHLDLDSDGDGCPDAKEANVSTNPGAAGVMSTSGGLIYTGGIPSGTANAYVGNGTPAQYGSNGLFNDIETGENGIYNSTYTYQYANSSILNACIDTDGDGVGDLIDIDDDNDGILDVMEQTCTTSNTVKTGIIVTKPSTINYTFDGTQILANLVDDIDANDYIIYSPTGTLSNSEWFRVELPSAKVLTSWEVGQYSGQTLFAVTSTYKVQGSNDGTVWADLTGTLTYSNTQVGQSTQANSNIADFPSNLTAYKYYRYYGISATVGTGWATEFYFKEKNCINIDTDNDGIPNHLDLDSDGDGCPDTKEAILYNHSTEASIPGTVKNGSGGTVTSTTANVPNAMVPGPYGSNGFADALQSASNPDAYKYVYTYQFVATAADVSTCDNKFLMDIDSDDDGIPDAVESPSCFYTETQAMDITEAVTSDFTWATANPLSNTYDNNTATTNYGAVTPAVSIQNKALITFDLPVIDAALIDNVKLNVGGVAFGAGKWKLQGLDMNTTLWTDLSDPAGQAMTTAGVTANSTFTNTLHPTVRYHSYRIIGIDNVNITNNARLIEFTIQYKNYNPSLHRTKTGCNSDADGDGVPNYIDRDSDGDGCPDALEAGISKSLLVPGSFFNTGGQVMGDYVTVGGNYGDNGLGDSVETAPDSGIVNYTSTYAQYATNKTLNFCTDTDGDNVPDLIDLDDDNDGVLDTTECTYPATPTNTSTSDIFAVWSNATTAAGTNLAPTYLTSAGSWTAGSGLTAAISGGVINISNVNGSTLGDAFGANEYLEHPFTTTADNYNWLYYVRSSASNATNYHWAMLISDDNFVTYTILNIDMIRTATGILVNDINDYQLTPSTAYKVRTYYWGAPAFTFDEFTMFGYSECDTDNDGVPNRLDLDSDGDGCTDAIEAGTAAQAGTGNTSAGTVVNTSGTQTGVANAIVGNNTPASYGANGFYNGIENNDTSTATYLGTYTYASAINAVISSCFCYRPAVTAGTILDTPQGITSLQRAGADNDNWPMVRKGAWTALESKTKGFVPNRLTNQQITDIPAANLIEGMMVYNSDANCLYINTDGTPTGWKCFNTQACPN